MLHLLLDGGLPQNAHGQAARSSQRQAQGRAGQFHFTLVEIAQFQFLSLGVEPVSLGLAECQADGEQGDNEEEMRTYGATIAAEMC